jgi:hypothetical protein
MVSSPRRPGPKARRTRKNSPARSTAYALKYEEIELIIMTMEETQQGLKEMLSKGASLEEILKSLTLSEGCGVKVWCEEQIMPGGEKRVHRYAGYVKRCDDPAENTEPVYGAWLDGPCPKKA